MTSPIERAREAAREKVAKRICMAAHGGDAERNHASITLSWGFKRDEYLTQADAAIAAYEAALSAEGMVVVPKEASEEMEWAALQVEISPSRIDGGRGAPDGEEIKVMVREIYAAMIAAASAHNLHEQQREKPEEGEKG